MGYKIKKIDDCTLQLVQAVGYDPDTGVYILLDSEDAPLAAMDEDSVIALAQLAGLYVGEVGEVDDEYDIDDELQDVMDSLKKAEKTWLH